MAFSLRILFWSALLLTATLVVASDDDDEGINVEVEEEEDVYQSPKIDPKKVYIAEHFDDVKAFKKRWVQSEAKKAGVDEDIAKYDGKWEIQTPSRKIFKDDSGLVLTTEAKHAAIAAMLDRPFQFTDKPLIVQYEVTMQEGQTCGGAYLKLLSKGVDSQSDLRGFHDQTPYTIMFGPDKCGNDNKLHFIFRHRNPKNGSYEEKHAKKPSERLDDIFKDKTPHLYRLTLRPDNTYSVSVDGREMAAGSLLADVSPPVNPPAEVDDPNDVRPEDWDEREKIVDPSATKPADWDETAPAQVPDPNAARPDGWLDDEPEHIPDPEADRPSDWDDDMDGEWEPPLVDNPACTAAPGCGPWSPPLISNPAYKGVWRAPLIPNPNYKGKWSPRRIPNPDYFNDEHPFRMTPIHAVGFELWSMSPMLLFDNLLVTDDAAAAAAWAAQTFDLKRAKISRDEASVVDAVLRLAEEHPWLYAVVVLTAVVVVGTIAYCCVSGNKEPEEDPKKTDAVTEDDPAAEDDPVDHDPPRAASKADLDLPPQDDSDDAPLLVDASGDAQRKRKPRKE